jgi:uncharacterized protein with PQ loop repeat
MMGFWLSTLLFLALPAILYIWFRFSVDSWLRREKRVGKSKLKKLKIGKRNFWWYEATHAQVDMGPLYWINKLFTISWSCAFGLNLLMGWIRVMSIVIGLFCAITYILASMMLIFSTIRYNLDEYGTPFVLIVRNKTTKRINSSLFDLMMVGLFAVIFYAHLIMICDLWGIQLPLL